MKKKILFSAAVALAFFSAGSLSAEENSQEEINASVPAKEKNAVFASSISSVTVFPQGARVTRTAKVQLRSGSQEIIITGFPQNMNKSGYLAEIAESGVKITSVTSDIIGEYVRDDAAGAIAQKKLVDKSFQIKKLTNRSRVLSENIERLNAFSPATIPADVSKEVKLTSFDGNAALKTADLICSELNKAQKESREISQKLKQAQLEYSVLQSEYLKLRNYQGKPRDVFRVNLTSERPIAECEISVSYMVDSAYWYPSYDIRVDHATKALNLISYGIISQQTGEDWNGVPVILSTAYPNSSAKLPEFTPIIIGERFIEPQTEDPDSFSTGAAGGNSTNTLSQGFISARPKAAAKSRAQQPHQAEKKYVLGNTNYNRVVLNDGKIIDNAQNIRYEQGNYVLDNAGFLEKYSAKDVLQISQDYIERDNNGSIQVSRLCNPAERLRGLDFRYELVRLETIKSNGEMHRYLLDSKNYTGTFFYKIVPAQSDKAYQMLTIGNKDFRPLLAGPANIFYGEDFIGDMDVPYTIQNGKVTIPLGVDQRISVKRTQTNNIETQGVFTESKRNTVDIKFTIENRTPEKIEVVVDDAVPVVSQEEIEISSLKFSPDTSSYDKKTGLIQWCKAIEPNKNLEIKTSFRINYPKDWKLSHFGTSAR